MVPVSTTQTKIGCRAGEWMEQAGGCSPVDVRPYIGLAEKTRPAALRLIPAQFS